MSSLVCKVVVSVLIKFEPAGKDPRYHSRVVAMLKISEMLDNKRHTLEGMVQ